MYLSLPLPSTTTRTMTVTVFYGNGSALPLTYTVTVLKHGCCKDLVQALSTECCLKPDESILLAEVNFTNSVFSIFSVEVVLQLSSILSNQWLFTFQVYNHKIFRYLENPFESLSSIKDDEHIVAYILPKKHEKLPRLAILHWKERYSWSLMFILFLMSVVF